MNSKQFLKEGFLEDAHEAHSDHEVQMARVDCYYAAEHAIVLHKLLRNISEEQGLEGWVASKITLANDYLKSVREHLEYQMMNVDADQDDFLPFAEGKKPTKKKLSESSDIQEFERGPWYIIISGEAVPDKDGTPRKFNWLNAAKSHFRKMLNDDPKVAEDLKKAYNAASDKKTVIYYSKKLPNNTNTQKTEPEEKVSETSDKPGLWANIRAKRARIKSGSGEKMRKPGSKGAPSDKDLKSIRASSVKENWRDDKFADNDLLRGPSMMPKYNYNFKTPEPKSREELLSRLKELEAEFDPAYQQSDDYGFWSKQNKIQSEIVSIKRQLEKQGVAEGGIVKSIKRRMQGWGDGVKPDDIKRRAGEYSDDELKDIAGSHDELRRVRATDLMPTEVPKHSPAGLQKRVVDREMRKRGLSQEQGMAEGKMFASKKYFYDIDGTKVKVSALYDLYGQKVVGNKVSTKNFATSQDALDWVKNRIKKENTNEGVAEAEKQEWEVSFEYGPHQSDSVKVKAASKEEAISKAKEQAKKTFKTQSLSLNWARPVKKGVAEGSLNEFSSDSEDDGYYKEYLRGYKDGKGYPEVVKSSKKREIWMTVTPKNPPLTEPYMRGWYDGKYGPAPGKDLIDLNKLNEQGVAEGLGDVVKGIKRKVAGKEDPKDVEHTYGRIARSAIKHKTPDQAEKDIKRWEKVNKVVNKEGVAEEIKGWKHAGRDLAQHRASLGKDVHLVLLKKDGTESKMNDAKKSFRSEDEARQYHERIKKLNPTRNIRHNLYVGDNVEKLD